MKAVSETVTASLAGKGGMDKFYRPGDLKLGQSVAMKFFGKRW